MQARECFFQSPYIIYTISHRGTFGFTSVDQKTDEPELSRIHYLTEVEKLMGVN